MLTNRKLRKVGKVTNLNNQPTWQRLRIFDVMAVTGLARSTIWKYIAAGSFPKPHCIGSRVRVWEAAEIQSWLEARKAEGQTHAA